MADVPWAGRKVHLVGVGGAGMSGWARVAVQLGATVSGSDRAESPNLDRLRALGVTVHVGHDAANVPDDADVFVSTAIPLEAVVELIVLAGFFRARGLAAWRWAAGLVVLQAAWVNVHEAALSGVALAVGAAAVQARPVEAPRPTRASTARRTRSSRRATPSWWWA